MTSPDLQSRDAEMVSGCGQFHTNEADPKSPDKRLRPYIGITWADITAMVDKPQEVPKEQAQWVIPSTLPSRCFLRQEREGSYWMLWADFDTDPQGVEAVATVVSESSNQFEVYSSRSATADKPKCRLMIPLDQPLSGGDWTLAQEALNDFLEGHKLTPDRVSQRTGQLCYLPNRGAFYEARSQRTGALFDPLNAWARRIDGKRQKLATAAAALEADRKAAAERKAARAASPGTQGRPTLIEAFNEAYSVSDILLQAGYAQRGDTFCHPASESGSYSARVQDGRVHSLSSSDPLYTGGAGGGAHDAFSAFEVLMHGGNRQAALKDAGDRWLTIGGEPWNVVTRREWAQQQAQTRETSPPADQQAQDLGDDFAHGAPAHAAFRVVPVADLGHAQVAAPAYWWDGYLPAGVVTLMGAHGGTGKSFISAMAAVCIAMGLPLFGIPTRCGRVAIFSGEDSGELLRHRLQWICRALGVDPAELGDRLHVLDATQGDPTLFHEVSTKGTRYGATTASYSALQAYFEHHGIDVLIVDNASDTFDGSEIDRARVRGFMRALARIAQVRGGAVLLLAHVDKGTSRGDRNGTEGYSGSTAWHNSARSRLFLSRDREGGLLLEHQKQQFGDMREPLRLSWPKGGIPQVDEPVNGVVQHIADNNDMKALLKLLNTFYGRGEFIATDPRSKYHAVKVLSDQATYPKRRKPAEIFQSLRFAEGRELIQREAYKDRNRKQHERWCLTDAGRELIGLAPSAPCAPSTDDGALDHPAQQGAPCAPCGMQGVWGNGARTEDGAMADELGLP